MNLYTVVLDYAGGTYICQHEAGDEQAALNKWLYRLSNERVAGELGKEIAVAYDPAISGLVAVDELSKVWCATTSAAQGLALINIIQTAA